MSLPSSARVLIVGSGGREHALAHALRRSTHVASLVFAGGPNAGLEAIAERIAPGDAERAEGFDLVVIGPEAPLADGLADRLRARGLAVFGPGAAAARLEASKAYAKAICARAGIPTAAAAVCATPEAALEAIERFGPRAVVKADGLAAGKGVVVADTPEQARRAVEEAFAGAFGAAGTQVLVEERLEGSEVSLFALSDGVSVRALGTARDYKRALDGDRGPNTGGMGAISPAPNMPQELVDAAMDRIVRPAIATLAQDGIAYVGVLYAGLMLTADGPKLIEFNARFGDPEAQALLPRLRSDPFALLHATATGALAGADLALSPQTALAVVVAAQGYPGEVRRGEPIGGLDAVARAGATVLHAGTRSEDGRVVSNGGRVLNVVASAPDPRGARQAVYAALERLDWPGAAFRRDIGAEL